MRCADPPLAATQPRALTHVLQFPDDVLYGRTRPLHCNIVTAGNSIWRRYRPRSTQRITAKEAIPSAAKPPTSGSTVPL